MLDSLTGVLWSSEEKSVASSWCSQGQLIKSQNLSTSSQNACASGSGEAQGSNADLWNSQETVVIGNGSNDDDGLVVGLLGCVRNNSGERHWRSVDARHEQATKDDLVEG